MILLCLVLVIDELKAAREILFRNSGTKLYSYKGPHDPATAHDKACHCTASIIAKMQELDTNCQQTIFKYVCSAVDLFRLMNLSNNERNGNNFEKRLQEVERDIKTIKSNSSLNSTNVHNQWPLPSVSNTSGSAALPSRRWELIKEMSNKASVSSPNKRKRSDDNNSDAWQEVARRKKAVKPGNQSVLKGKPPSGAGPNGAELWEVFPIQLQ